MAWQYSTWKSSIEHWSEKSIGKLMIIYYFWEIILWKLNLFQKCKSCGFLPWNCGSKFQVHGDLKQWILKVQTSTMFQPYIVCACPKIYLKETSFYFLFYYCSWRAPKFHSVHININFKQHYLKQREILLRSTF